VTVRRIPLVDLRRDGGTQVRETMNAATVQDYADALAEGAEFPAVTVFFDGEAHWLADGFHRVLAHERAGLVDVLADVRTGSKRDALRFALSANRGHGLQMSTADKRRAISIILADDEWRSMSDRGIAAAIGVSNKFVGDMRRESGVNGTHLAETRTGKDGKQYPAKRAKPTDPAPPPPAESDHPAVAAIASAPTRDALDAAYTAANGAGLSGHDAEEAGKVYQRKAAELRAQAPTITPTVPTHEQVDLFTQAAPAAPFPPAATHGGNATKETSPAPVPPRPAAADASEVAALRAKVEALEVEAADLRTDNALLYASNEAFSEWAALMKSRIDRAPETVKGTVNLDRVRKLVELAGSPNENEARNAAMAACRAIRDHRVRLVTDNPLHSSDPMEKALRELHDAMRDAGIQP